MKFYCRDKQIVQFLNLYLICALEWLEDISPDPIWKEQKRCPFLGVWDRNLILLNRRLGIQAKHLNLA